MVLETPTPNGADLPPPALRRVRTGNHARA